MKKVYVVEYVWEGNSRYDDFLDWENCIVGVANSSAEAAEMCCNARKEKIAEILAEDPKAVMDINDEGVGAGSYYLEFVDDPQYYFGTHKWVIHPFDLIGS